VPRAQFPTFPNSAPRQPHAPQTLHPLIMACSSAKIRFLIIICWACGAAVGGGCTDTKYKTKDNGKALSIKEVVCEAHRSEPGVMPVRLRMITAHITNAGTVVVFLGVGNGDGRTLSESDIEQQRRTDPDFQNPYGLGIEAGSPKNERWSPPMTRLGHGGWVPTERPGQSAKDRRSPWYVDIEPGETRVFSYEVEAEPASTVGVDAYRVFILNPDAKRIDERVCVSSP
jgi:hypothetical protein